MNHRLCFACQQHHGARPWLSPPHARSRPALHCTAQPPPAGGGMAMGTDFFETSAMLVTLVLFGKYLESVVRL